MLIDQKSVDERLVRRGELLLSLEFLERYADELEAMNRGKEGRPFTLTNSYIVFFGCCTLPFRVSLQAA